MKLTDALLGEHGVIYALLSHVERQLPELGTLEDVQRLARTLQDVLVAHARIEDELLFPPLETQIGPAGPLAVMRAEHTAIEEALADVAGAASLAHATGRLGDALAVTRPHFAKEERILFPLAQRALGDSALDELGARWADVRGVEIGGGHF